MTLAELKTARSAAGSRYAAAVAELQESLIDLAALDAALANRAINDGIQDLSTYGLPKIPESLQDFEHQSFAPSLRARLADQIAVARDGYIEGFEL